MTQSENPSIGRRHKMFCLSLTWYDWLRVVQANRKPNLHLVRVKT